MHHRLSLFASGLALCATATAQNGWYFDFGDPQSIAGTPSSTYAAAAPIGGTWNAIDTPALMGGPFPASVGSLVDIANAPSTATLEFDEQGSGLFGLAFNNGNTQGDDQALMDDITYFGLSGTLRLSGVPAGTYDVYTYAMAPDNAAYLTDVEVTGAPADCRPSGATSATGINRSSRMPCTR